MAMRRISSTRDGERRSYGMSAMASALPLAQRIHTVRGHKVLLIADLAALYKVPTKALVQAMKRNPERFPADFMFHLTEQEVRALRSQNCDLRRSAKPAHRPRQAPEIYALRVHGTGRRHAFVGAKEQTGSAGQCGNHARLRALARPDRPQPRARAQAQSAGIEIRPPVQGRLRCH